MIFLKIIVSIISIRLIIKGPCECCDYKKEVGIPLIIFGVIGISISISLWGSFQIPLIISIIALIISIVVIILINIVRRRKEKESSLKENFATITNLSEKLLKTVHCFLSDELKLKNIDTQTEKKTKSGKVVLKSNTFENRIIITKDTKGRLIAIDNDEIKIQFDTDEDCFLIFKKDDSGYFKLNTNKDKIIYNKKEYSLIINNDVPFVMCKLIRQNTHKTKTHIAKGVKIHREKEKI